MKDLRQELRKRPGGERLTLISTFTLIRLVKNSIRRHLQTGMVPVTVLPSTAKGMLTPHIGRLLP